MPQLVTIPYSNFCELARWCLAARGAYIEIGRPPLLHILPTLALRFGSGKHVAQSSGMSGKAGSPTGVPVCAMPDGQVLIDSWHVLDVCSPQLDWSDEGMTDELRHTLDKTLGPHARLFAYQALLKPSNSSIWNELLTHKQSCLWRLLCRLGLGKKLGAMLRKDFKLEDEEYMKAKAVEIDQGLEQLASQLERRGTPYFGGSTPGTADIAVAALLAPFVFPPQYCGGKYNTFWDRLLAETAGFQARVDKYRATPIGKLILRVYDESYPGQGSTPTRST